MESTIVADGADGSTAVKDNPLFGDDTTNSNNLFDDAPLEEPSTTTTTDTNGKATNLMGQLLGEDNNTSTNGDITTTPVSQPTSKLSSSGLIETTKSDSLFGQDDIGGSGGSGSGLFDDVDAEEAEKEQQRLQAEAEAQKQAQLEEQQRLQAEEAEKIQQNQTNISLNNHTDIMHDLNLNGDNGDFMGMGMGLGGEIPKAPHAAPPATIQSQQQAVVGNQYQQYPYQPPPPQQPQQQQGVMNAMASSYMYSTTGAGQMTQQHHQQYNNTTTINNHNQQQQTPQPSVLAGMHVGHDVNLGGVAPSSSPTHTSPSRYTGARSNSFPPAPSVITNYVPPPPFDPFYGKIVVNDPMLIQGTGLFAGPPHWTYLVTVHAKNASEDNPQQPISAVRRRFRHFVALEDRLRQSVPGAILPPRPDKHPARAIEEATARQSSDFAEQRSQELSVYMNALVKHPHAGMSPELKLFLTLQDHIGTAWPEVSSSAFTRITAVGSATVEKLTDSMDGMLSELGTAQQVAAGEDSAEILALAAYEGRRIGAVSSSVPKIDGAVSLIRDRGDRLGAIGLEMSKLAKDVGWCDRDLASPMEILSSALLRSGRRTKRLGLELSAAIAPFLVQYRMCKYEQMAFVDRRTSLKHRTEARTKADGKAAKLMMNQTSMQSMGRLGTLERMETEAAMYDEMAMEASKEADEVAQRLQSEVGRIGSIRVKEWDASMKVIASGFKEACAENASVWESALENFKREWPDIGSSGV